MDRSQQSSLSDARDAFINVVIDALSAYKLTQSSSMGAGLLAPKSLRLLPLYILALLKNVRMFLCEDIVLLLALKNETVTYAWNFVHRWPSDLVQTPGLMTGFMLCVK